MYKSVVQKSLKHDAVHAHENLMLRLAQFYLLVLT